MYYLWVIGTLMSLKWMCACSIINIGRTLISGLPRKQDGCPVGYITSLTLISRPNRGVKNFWRHICGPLPMAILTGPLMSINDTGKVPNRKVAKSQIVLLILLLILILLLVKILFHHNSVVLVDTTLKITPMNGAYSWAAPFRCTRIDGTTDFLIHSL